MAKIAEYTFDDKSDDDMTDTAGEEEFEGEFEGGAYSDGQGTAHFDGKNDYGIVEDDDDLNLGNGTIAIEFTQSSTSPANTPRSGAHTLFSSDANGYGSTDGDHLTIWIDKSGEIQVRHQTNGKDYTYSGGKVVPGEPVQMSYAFGKDGSVLTVNGTVVDTGSVDHDMAGGTNGFTIGASMASATEGTSNKINGFFHGEISRVAIYDSKENFNDVIPCFVAGTRILTPSGERAVESLRIGDWVTTLDGCTQQIRWITKSYVNALTLQHNPKMRPVILPNHTTSGTPLRLSRQHCVLMKCHQNEVLVRAAHLERNGMAIQSEADTKLTYVHLMLDGHHVICADGIPCETLLAGKISHRMMVKTGVTPTMQPVRPILTGKEVRAAVRAGVLTFADWPMTIRRMMTA